MSGVDGILEQLLGVFPDADAEHVRQRITATSVVTPERNALFDQLVTEMLSTEYPKKIAEMDLTRQDPAQAAKELSDKTKCLAELRNLFSDVDVRWLENLYDQTFEKKKDSAITAGSFLHVDHMHYCVIQSVLELEHIFLPTHLS